MSNCPCCSNQMVRHIRKQQVHWFCRRCWQEMPNLVMTYHVANDDITTQNKFNEDSHLLLQADNCSFSARYS